MALLLLPIVWSWQINFHLQRIGGDDEDDSKCSRSSSQGGGGHGIYMWWVNLARWLLNNGVLPYFLDNIEACLMVIIVINCY